MSAPTCPKCAQTMTGGQLGPIRLTLCLACRGVWLGSTELQQLIKAGPVVLRRLSERLAGSAGATPTAPIRTGLTCPHCSVPLASTEPPTLPGARMEYCRFCSNYWLAVGTIERIAGLLAPPPAPQPTPAAPVAPRAPQPSPLSPAAPRAPEVSPYAVAYAGPVAGAPAWTAPKQVQPQQTAPPSRPGSPSLPKVSAIERQICASCGESNGPNAAVCWACGKGFVGRILGTCPRCEGQLREVESAGVQIGACDGCNGVWAEEGRLVALLRQPAAAREQVIRQVERTRTGKIRKYHPGLVCRTCELILLRAPMMVSSEPVDTCPGCSGTFLEEGVLPLMLRSGEVW